ncbi:MAG: hypothetical protein QM773_15760 [Hyphomonadaceae bacterium]
MLASRYTPYVAVLAVLIVSRLVTHALGLMPDPAIVIDHWQHIDLRLLASDPVGSLWALHTQPPLWNGILALAVAIAGPDGDAVTAVMYGFNLLLTAGAGLLILDILSRFGFSRPAATVFACVSILSPNILYFETYIFYPHFTFFLVTLLLWLMMRIKRDGALWPVAGALSVLTALSLTWAIFHPVFIALAGAALLWWNRGFSLAHAARPVIAMAILATGVSALPTLKNLAIYGVPSASTWIGLNLAQTIPGGQTGEFVHCDFDTAHREAIAANPGLPTDNALLTQTWKRPGAPNMNHIGMIAASQRCLDMTKNVILHDPIGWFAFRLNVLVGTHQLPPSNYNADPLGWDAIFGPAERLTDSFGQVSRIAMTLWYLMLLWMGVKLIRTNRPLYLSLLGVIAYFTLASHFLNGGEQARMRYTIEPIYLLFSAGLLGAAVRRYGPMLKLRALGLADAP